MKNARSFNRLLSQSTKSRKLRVRAQIFFLSYKTALRTGVRTAYFKTRAFAANASGGRIFSQRWRLKRASLQALLHILRASLPERVILLALYFPRPLGATVPAVRAYLHVARGSTS